MAVPKKKMSRSRTRRRKAHWRLSVPKTVACEQCGKPKLSHRACKECGTYAGRDVIEAS